MSYLHVSTVKPVPGSRGQPVFKGQTVYTVPFL